MTICETCGGRVMTDCYGEQSCLACARIYTYSRMGTRHGVGPVQGHSPAQEQAARATKRKYTPIQCDGCGIEFMGRVDVTPGTRRYCGVACRREHARKREPWINYAQKEG